MNILPIAYDAIHEAAVATVNAILLANLFEPIDHVLPQLSIAFAEHEKITGIFDTTTVHYSVKPDSLVFTITTKFYNKSELDWTVCWSKTTKIEI